MNRTKRNVGIFVFENAEVLDFAGPFEVFSVTSELHNHSLFNVSIVAQELSPVIAVNGLSVNPNYDFETCPDLDILIIAGGFGTRKQLANQKALDWIAKQHQHTEYTLSICTGSTLLGALRYLDEQPYCTHHEVYDMMEELVPSGKPQKEKRFVQTGKIFTSGGISAGIDLSFHLVQKLLGSDIAAQTAKYMEYDHKLLIT